MWRKMLQNCHCSLFPSITLWGCPGPVHLEENNRNGSYGSYYVLQDWLIRLVGNAFANGPGDLGSIQGRVIPKTLKWYLIPPCLTQLYEVRIKWSNPGKGVAPYPTSRCSSYWKGSLLVPLNYCRQQLTFCPTKRSALYCVSINASGKSLSLLYLSYYFASDSY